MIASLSLPYQPNPSAIYAFYWIGLTDPSGIFSNALWYHSNTSVGNWNLWYTQIVVDTSKLCAGIQIGTYSLYWTNMRCSDAHRFICQLGIIYHYNIVF